MKQKMSRRCEGGRTEIASIVRERVRVEGRLVRERKREVSCMIEENSVA